MMRSTCIERNLIKLQQYATYFCVKSDTSTKRPRFVIKAATMTRTHTSLVQNLLRDS